MGCRKRPARGRGRVAWRAVVALGHVLYGVVAAGRLACEHPRPRPRRVSAARGRPAAVRRLCA